MSGSTYVHNPKDLFWCWQWRLMASFEVTCSTNKTPLPGPAHLTRKLTWPTAQLWLPCFSKSPLRAGCRWKELSRQQQAAPCSWVPKTSPCRMGYFLHRTRELRASSPAAEVEARSSLSCWRQFTQSMFKGPLGKRATVSKLRRLF